MFYTLDQAKQLAKDKMTRYQRSANAARAVQHGKTTRGGR